MQHYGRKTAQAGAHNTGRAANVSGSPSTSSRPHPTTRPVSSQSPHKHVRHNTKVPTAKDRPHLRDNCVYLGDVPCGTLQDGVFTRSFDSTRNTLLWGTHLSYRVDLLRLLKREGTHTLHANDSATRDRYAVSLADFLREAEPFKSTRCGDQLALDLDLWQRQLPLGGPVQLGLFSGVTS
jgi:hypothetical protein